MISVVLGSVLLCVSVLCIRLLSVYRNVVSVLLELVGVVMSVEWLVLMCGYVSVCVLVGVVNVCVNYVVMVGWNMLSVWVVGWVVVMFIGVLK